MPITVDGNSLIIDNATITINNAFDPTTGIATITITPAGGLGTLPGLLQGEPGMPATFGNVTVTLVPNGSQPAAPVLTQTSPGGPGESSVYDLNIEIPEGPPGQQGAAGSISGSVSGTPAPGDTIVANGSGGYSYQPPPTSTVGAAPSTSSTAGSSSTRILATAVLASTWLPYYPICSGGATIVGTANTVVNLQVRLNDPASGDVVAYANGTQSATGLETLTLWSNFADVVPPNQSNTYYLVATQVAATQDNWSTNASQTSLTVWALPTL